MARLFKIDGSGKASDVPSDSNGTAEQELEELLVANPEMITGEKLFIIGRQVRTDDGKNMDLVGVIP